VLQASVWHETTIDSEHVTRSIPSISITRAHHRDFGNIKCCPSSVSDRFRDVEEMARWKDASL